MDKTAMHKEMELRLAMAQLDPCVGDIAGNLRLAKQAVAAAAAQKADIIIFSELFLSGYAPEDLVLKPAFLAACETAALELAAAAGEAGIAVLVGAPVLRRGQIKNAALLLEDGKIIAERYKMDLPNYDEFDEKRVFTAGAGAEATDKAVEWCGIKFGLPICEDIWNNADFCRHLAGQGAELILAINASPYRSGKPVRRFDVAEAQAKAAARPLIYVNQFGGQDELVFDGGSFALDSAGRIVARARHFAADLAFTDWRKGPAGWHCVKGEKQPRLTGEEADYTACMIGLRDYMAKNGFKKALIGLSGGVDSALCAVMAADAIGAENLTAIMLPYHYTSRESVSDAEQCARNIGCAYQSLPIAPAVEAAAETLAPALENGRTLAQIEAAAKKGQSFLWLENTQSRMRGLFLMAVSNKTGAMLITTGNKSEMAVGFATLYGDMNGGFNPIKDVYKMQVYALCRWRNAHKPQDSRFNEPAGAKGSRALPIPPQILTKAPSAELREGQRDEDRLPPYPVLDAILHGLVEEEQSAAALVKRGLAPAEVVERVEQLLYIAEYKRRQSAPGVKISAKAFGKMRRYPITNRFRTAGL